MSLRLTGIKKHYPDFKIDVSLEANDGEILTLLGPSGCGKTSIRTGYTGILPFFPYLSYSTHASG